jgi:hypothetical protein
LGQGKLQSRCPLSNPEKLFDTPLSNKEKVRKKDPQALEVFKNTP